MRGLEFQRFCHSAAPRRHQIKPHVAVQHGAARRPTAIPHREETILSRGRRHKNHSQS
jgi:hypothetical protein